MATSTVLEGVNQDKFGLKEKRAIMACLAFTMFHIYILVPTRFKREPGLRE